MSTDYNVTLTASDGTIATIVITHTLNPLPASDPWTASDSTMLGVQSGYVSSWGAQEADLSGPVGAKSIVLEGFSKQTEPQDSGKGEKNYDGGTLPLGSLDWTCDSKS